MRARGRDPVGSAAGTISAFDEIPASRSVADEGGRTGLVDEQGVGCAVPRPRQYPQIAPAGRDDVAVRQHDVGLEGVGGVADEIPEPSLASITDSGTPWWRMSSTENERSAADRSA